MIISAICTCDILEFDKNEYNLMILPSFNSKQFDICFVCVSVKRLYADMLRSNRNTNTVHSAVVSYQAHGNNLVFLALHIKVRSSVD